MSNIDLENNLLNSRLNISLDVYPYRYPWVVKFFDYSKYCI